MLSYSRWLAGILVIAILARVAILLYAEQRPARFDYPDSHRYIAVARNIAVGCGPIETSTSDGEAVLAGTDPLYPVVLAIGVRLGFDGEEGDAGLMRFGRLVNALFGVISVALLAALARRLLRESPPRKPARSASEGVPSAPGPVSPLVRQSCSPFTESAPTESVKGIAPTSTGIPSRGFPFASSMSLHHGACPPHDLLAAPSAALIASALLALDPIMLFFNALTLTESLYIMLLLAGFCCIVRSGERIGWLWAAVAGLLLGGAAVARSSGLLLPVIAAPVVWYLARQGRCPPESEARRTLGSAGASPSLSLAGASPSLGSAGASPSRGRCPLIMCGFLLAAAVALLPTAIRNYELFGAVVPVRTGAGASLLEALGSWADGGPGMDRIIYPTPPEGANEWERDRFYRRAAFAWVREHPAEAVRLAGLKLLRTWSVTINAPGYSSPRYVLIGWLTVAPVFALALCGLWVIRRHRALLVLLLLVPVYFSLVHVVFIGSVRYRVPAMPFVFILAAVGAVGLWRRLTCRTLASRTGAEAVCAEEDRPA